MRDNSHDPEADAVYIPLSDAKYYESEEVAPGVMLDFDAEGRVIGIEIISASKVIAPGPWRDWRRPDASGHSHAAE